MAIWDLGRPVCGLVPVHAAHDVLLVVHKVLVLDLVQGCTQDPQLPGVAVLQELRRKQVHSSQTMLGAAHVEKHPTLQAAAVYQGVAELHCLAQHGDGRAAGVLLRQQLDDGLDCTCRAEAGTMSSSTGLEPGLTRNPLGLLLMDRGESREADLR